jgi:hypothetical protein
MEMLDKLSAYQIWVATHTKSTLIFSIYGKNFERWGNP